MTATLLTDALINRMPPPAKEVLLRDAQCEGLCLRLQPGGSRSWILWERRDGRSFRVTLGAWPALDVAAARAAFVNRRAGQTLLPVHASTATFGDLARACITARRLICKPSTMASFETSLNTQLLPAFGEKPVDQITPAMVARWFHSYSRTSPGGANMALAAITTVLNWAKASGKLPKATPNPAAPIRKNRRPPRGRMLSSAQVLALRRLLMARQGKSQAVDVIHLLLLTGCRFGEIAGLTWAEVLPDRLTLKDAKTGPRDVFLSTPAREILKRLKESTGQATEPRGVCRRLHVWMPRFMQVSFSAVVHVIGCGHVSGLSMRHYGCCRPSWRYAEQAQINSTSFSLLEPRCFS